MSRLTPVDRTVTSELPVIQAELQNLTLRPSGRALRRFPPAVLGERVSGALVNRYGILNGYPR